GRRSRTTWPKRRPRSSSARSRLSLVGSIRPSVAPVSGRWTRESGRAGRPPMRIMDVADLGRVSMPDAPELLSPLPDREVTVTYPEAPPAIYLGWLAYFREVE